MQVLLGEIDDEKEESQPLQKVSLERILEAQTLQQREKEEEERVRKKVFKERGLAYTTEVAGDDNY